MEERGIWKKDITAKSGFNLVLTKVGQNEKPIVVPFEDFIGVSEIMEVKAGFLKKKWGFVVCTIKKKIPFNFASKEMAMKSLSSIEVAVIRVAHDYKNEFPNRVN